MANEHEHENDNDSDDREPDDAGRAVAPAPTGGALTSLEALAKALNSVDTSALVGRSGKPMMLFKREGDGTYIVGQRRTIPEEGSRWAANPQSFGRGYIAFVPGKRPVERMFPITMPMPDITTLPDVGVPWNEQWAVDLKCLNGTDAGVESRFKMPTDGGVKAIAGLLDEVRDRINGGQHDGKMVPVVQLNKNWYPHPQYGKVWYPVLTIVSWMSLDGPAAEPAPPPPPPPTTTTTTTSAPSEPPPRRRRVA